MKSKLFFTLFPLIAIFVIAFVVRLHRIDNPIADWHSWRQADTSAVSRNFVKNGFDVMHPLFDDLSNIPSTKENPNGYRFVEFPLYNLAQAGLYSIFNNFSLEMWGRLVTVISSLFSMLFIYLLVSKYIDKKAGYLSVFFYAFLPFNIYYSRVILPDPSMVMAILGGVYFFDKWIEKDSKSWIWYSLALVFTAAAFLIKPYALFFTLPMIYLAYKRYKLKIVVQWKLWIFVFCSVAPLVFWRLWMTQYPEGIPVNDWLFNMGNIRFKGAFFYWIFADRIGRLILGYWGVALFVVGLIGNKYDKKGFFFSFLASSLLYITVIARGNVQHDYYQILIVPTLAIFLGIGSHMLLFPDKSMDRRVTVPVFVICTVFSFMFGWYFVRDYFNINNNAIVEAGKIVDAKTPPTAKVIAPYGGDTSFLYQTNRRGWPIMHKQVETMIQEGAQYMIIVNPTKSDIEGFGKRYEVVDVSSSYLLLKLK